MQKARASKLISSEALTKFLGLLLSHAKMWWLLLYGRGPELPFPIYYIPVVQCLLITLYCATA